MFCKTLCCRFGHLDRGSDNASATVWYLVLRFALLTVLGIGRGTVPLESFSYGYHRICVPSSVAARLSGSISEAAALPGILQRKQPARAESACSCTEKQLRK